MKVNVEKSPIVILSGEKRSKSVYFGNSADLTAESIVSFLQKYEDGKVKSYKMDEEASEEQVVEDEL